MADRKDIYVGRKVVGYVEDGIFFKSVQGSKHFLRKPPAICFDVSTLNTARSSWATQVRVYDKESGLVYVAPLENIERYGFKFNRGFGNQIGLVMEQWETEEPNA